MNILSLFDGISCGKVALERAGIVCDKYYSSEIDKYAIQVSQANYPDIIQLGDVKNIDTSKLPKIDLLLAGFPCQSFSIAGKGKGFEDERGNLFFDLMRIFKEIKPKYFLFENVASMRKEHREKFDEIIGVKSIMINSSLVSAQQRKRLYWCNWDVEQPEDKGILLKDIIEEGVVDRDKSYCVDANYHKGGNLKSYFDKGRRQLVFDFNKQNRVGHFNKGGQADRIYSTNGKSVALSALGGGGGAKTGLYHIPHGYIKEKIQEHDKYPALCSQSPASKHLLIEKNCIRKLTPIECERLQTLKDGFTSAVSNTQRYKCLGNGWTVDVITHILKGIKEVHA